MCIDFKKIVHEADWEECDGEPFADLDGAEVEE